MNDDGSIPDSPSLLANNVDPVVRGFVKDWDAMEDLLHHVLYNGLGWEIGYQRTVDIAPVIGGAVQHVSSRRLEIGGVDLTKLFKEELAKSSPLMKLDMSEVKKLKEQYACCPDDDIAYGKTLESCPEEKHTFPDGS
nr:actin-related protein 7 [Tanacetum cinerariifolium]